MSYEAGATASLRAMHAMPVEGPEGVLHPHAYRIEVVTIRRALDERGMVVDLDVLREAMTTTLEPLEDTDLGSMVPADSGVTVEVFARWIHDAMSERLAAEGAESMRVRVWESDTEFAGYAADVRDVVERSVSTPTRTERSTPQKRSAV